MWSRLSSVVLKNVFCFTLILGVGYAQWIVEDDGCRTPDRGVGNCISLVQCAPMVNVLKSLKRPISQSILKKLQAYTCGTEDGGVKVCCPSGPIIVDPQSTPNPKPDGPPDVSNHKNLYLLPKNCGYLDADNKIINGEDAYLNEFPWMALLRYKGKRGVTFNCGGTIINKNYILTAGHCITGLSSELVAVRVGEHSINNDTDCEVLNNKRTCNPPVQDLKIEEVIPHPKFGTSSFLNDIGLIRVSTINLDLVNARPVCLPLTRQKDYKRVIVTGWGVTNTETGQTSDILQKVSLPIADKQSCTKTYKSHNIVLGDSQICAGGAQNKDSCPGDSGGPMLAAIIDDTQTSKYVQEGVVSFGPKYCGITGYPGVYTLVRYFMDWILDNMKP